MEYLNSYLSSPSLRLETDMIALSDNKNILEGIRYLIHNQIYRSQTDLNIIKEDFVDIREKSIQLYFLKKQVNFKELEKVKDIIEIFIYQELYDEIISIVRQKFAENNLEFYKLSKYCCTQDVSPKQLGSTFYNVIPKAALVESSLNLTNQRTPLEKLSCLCTTYDFVFVEVKTALISIISKYSDKEIDIPIVSNQEIVPILMAVILKSKCFYFPSDLFYIRHFGSDFLKKNQNLDKILELKTTVGRIDKNICEKLHPNLDVPETIRFVEEIETKNTFMDNTEIKNVIKNFYFKKNPRE